jgi:hypothetical protein
MSLTGTFTGIGNSPSVTSAVALDAEKVRIVFSEPMSLNSGLGVVSNYTFNHNVTTRSVSIAVDNTSVTITTSGLQAVTTYTVTASSNLTDIAGNLLTGNTATFSSLSETIPVTTIAEDCPDDNESFQRLVRFMPALYKPTVNPIVKGVLVAFGQGDCVVNDQIKEFKDQLFVVSASDQYLDRLGQNVGVERPTNLGMHDEDYRDLIPVMSFMPKQIRQPIQELMKIWYGDESVYANVTGTAAEPISLTDGQTLSITTESGTFDVTFNTNDFANINQALCDEIVISINRQIEGSVAKSRTDHASLVKHLNLRTNVFGSTGFIQVSGTSLGALGLSNSKYTMSSLHNPAVVYEVNNKELIVILPSSPIVIKRNLPGAFYLNPSTSKSINSAYIFDAKASMTVSGTTGITSETLSAGTVKTTLLATLSDSWPSSGYFSLDYGKSTQEGPIKFVGKPNNANLVVDPSYVFKKNHASGSKLNYVTRIGASVVATDTTSPAAYVTGVAIARNALKDLIEKVVAAGVSIKFIVQTPGYKFSNAALNTNEAV